MHCARRFGVFRPTWTQARCQSAGNTPIPERNAKFRRTVAPIAREHLGVSVLSKFCEHECFRCGVRHDADSTCTPKAGATRPTQAKSSAHPPKKPTRNPPRAVKLISDVETYEMIADATQSSYPQRTKKSVPRLPNNRPLSGPNTTARSPSRRTTSESKSRRAPSRRVSETFDAESFIQAQAFDSWRNADDGVISEGKLKELRKTTLNYMRAHLSAVEAKVAHADGNEPAQSLGEFRAFVQTRDPRAVIDTFSYEVPPVPWALTRKSQPMRPWERTSYTAAPTRPINIQRRMVNRSLKMFARRMYPTSRIPSTTLSSNTPNADKLLNIPASPAVPHTSALLSIAEGSVGASRGAQVFRHEVLAGDYDMCTLVKVKANHPAPLAAKMAAVSNVTMSLGDKISAVTLVSRLATR